MIGGGFMSVVQAIIMKNFLLVGADKRAIYPNGDFVENHNKLIKLNNEIIFGCTGGTFDNFKLFEGYCNYSKENGFVKVNNDFNISYNEFVKIISNRLVTIHQEHIDKNIDKKYEIGSIVCGYNGKEFECTIFSVGSKYGFPDGIIKTNKPIDFPYKGVTAGKIIHKEKLEELYEKTYKKYGELTLRQCKNIMLDVFEEGSKLDSTINNDVCFETIKKKDVM